MIANDSDVDGDTLSVTELNGSAVGIGSTVTLASGAQLTLNADGSLAYDPNGQFEHLDVGETATDTFSYTVYDGNGETDSATVTITIQGEEDAPSGTGSLSTATLNDNAGPTSLFGAITISDADSTESGFSLRITLSSPGAGVILGGGFVETGPGTGVYVASGLTQVQADAALDAVILYACGRHRIERQFHHRYRRRRG